MTSVQIMLGRAQGASKETARLGLRTARVPGARSALGVLLLGALVLLGGCATKDDGLRAPEALVSPYSQREGEALWAVVPLLNESGVSSIDTEALSDVLISKISEVRGVSCLPLNRTIEAMRARELRRVDSPTEARMIAAALGVDAVVVGSVTAWDPYDPPKIGLVLAVHAREPVRAVGSEDPMSLQRSYTDQNVRLASQHDDRPEASVTAYLDGANHEVQMDLRRFAEGRHELVSALGWRRYLVSMDLYVEFASHYAVRRLLEQERLRLSRERLSGGDL